MKFRSVFLAASVLSVLLVSGCGNCVFVGPVWEGTIALTVNPEGFPVVDTSSKDAQTLETLSLRVRVAGVDRSGNPHVAIKDRDVASSGPTAFNITVPTGTYSVSVVVYIEDSIGQGIAFRGVAESGVIVERDQITHITLTPEPFEGVADAPEEVTAFSEYEVQFRGLSPELPGENCLFYVLWRNTPWSEDVHSMLTRYYSPMVPVGSGEYVAELMAFAGNSTVYHQIQMTLPDFGNNPVLHAYFPSLTAGQDLVETQVLSLP